MNVMWKMFARMYHPLISRFNMTELSRFPQVLWRQTFVNQLVWSFSSSHRDPKLAYRNWNEMQAQDVHWCECTVQSHVYYLPEEWFWVWFLPIQSWIWKWLKGNRKNLNPLSLFICKWKIEYQSKKQNTIHLLWSLSQTQPLEGEV